MRLFLDTNIFVEFIEQRKQFEQVCLLIDSILEKRFSAFISTGSLYTLAFLFERSLKRQDVHRPELTTRLRGYLDEVLSMATLVELSHAGAVRAISPNGLCDIEDSFQYQCAIENHCDVFITINIHDFEKKNTKVMEILTPLQFVEKYMQNHP
ncbi:MAG: hypothetical protein J5506_06450 [Prevotella sp.]|nr:hypothetical protein [Prevotella sp.]